MERELTMLTQAVQDPERPKVAHLGGVKADDSIAVARHMLEKNIVDTVLTSGGVANIFLDASGVDPGEPTTEFMRREVDDYDAIQTECKEVLRQFSTRILLPPVESCPWSPRCNIRTKSSRRAGPRPDLRNQASLPSMRYISTAFGRPMVRLRRPPEWGVEPVPDSLRILRTFDLFVLWSSLGAGLLVLAAGAPPPPPVRFFPPWAGTASPRGCLPWSVRPPPPG